MQLERMLPKDGKFDHMRKTIEQLDKVGGAGTARCRCLVDAYTHTCVCAGCGLGQCQSAASMRYTPLCACAA